MFDSFKNLLLHCQEEEVFPFLETRKDELNNFARDGNSLLVIALEMYVKFHICESFLDFKSKSFFIFQERLLLLLFFIIHLSDIHFRQPNFEKVIHFLYQNMSTWMAKESIIKAASLNLNLQALLNRVCLQHARVRIK